MSRTSEAASYREMSEVPVEVTVFAPKAIAVMLTEDIPDVL
jgi:hypothetical protein